ncbi:CHAT domain-containing protein [Candidatus Parabeggiatoa sp. HSG14]|uniref:CHAT domain-containing protein n=1 Tax=Candidatus Parabeggiatoa sp. HSG14 TaxID=3055593 RepID=UPI0025A708D6|nr:CHAT domain-containing protein [Thiotrichales bacterium HSG14]
MMIKTQSYFLRFFLCVFILSFHKAITAEDGQLLQQAQQAFQRGAFQQAIESWETAQHQTDLTAEQQVNILISSAIAYQALGNYQVARTILHDQALPLAKQLDTQDSQLLIHSHLSDILLAQQRPQEAETYLSDDIIELARKNNNPLILAHILNNRGNVRSILQIYAERHDHVHKFYAKAVQDYAEAAQLAQRDGDKLLQISALNNQLQAHLRVNQKLASLLLSIEFGKSRLKKLIKKVKAETSGKIITTLNTLETLIHQLPTDYDQAFQLLGLGQQAWRFYEYFADETYFNLAYELVFEARQLAAQNQDNALRAQANGLLGKIYAHQHRYQEAQQLTQQAIFLSQDKPEQLFRWESQLGNIFQTQVETQTQKLIYLKKAEKTYQQAFEHLEPIQTELLTRRRNSQELFYQQIRPVYFGFADVLLQQAQQTTSEVEKKRLLKSAIDRIEVLKKGELQEYFQGDCLLPISSGEADLDQLLGQNTALFYPILLENRLELLLRLPGNIFHQETQPVALQTLKGTVHEFRRQMKKGGYAYEDHAEQLYDWLIAPLQVSLNKQGIDTLIIVPDGPLRTVPLTALRNKVTGHFLIQDFAVATIPGFNLTDPRRFSKPQLHVLLNGLSVEVEGFSPLTNAKKEIENLEKIFINKKTLLNEQFTLDTFQQALHSQPYSIIHIASHGQFKRNPKDTFLLVHGDRLTMDKLENYLNTGEHGEQAELLTLSACQTAVGDERAALGLAGVAIKAGVQSAIASLWSVDDEATSELMTLFYQNLSNNPALSKVKAFQQSQQTLIADEYFEHPKYWAPFLLIGNWL